MAEFPLLPIRNPVRDRRPKGTQRRSRLRLPSRDRQGERLQPTFQRLRDVFEAGRDPVTLREDPAGIAPERALVLDVAGGIEDFYRAAQRIDGLEYLGDEETEFDADEDFAKPDTRRGRKGKDRRRPAGAPHARPDRPTRSPTSPRPRREQPLGRRQAFRSVLPPVRTVPVVVTTAVASAMPAANAAPIVRRFGRSVIGSSGSGSG